VTAAYVVEAWDFNGRRRDAVAGGAATIALPVRKHWTVAFEAIGLRVLAPGKADASVVGLSVFGRLRLAGIHKLALFLEGGAGPSYASIPVPERGTRFNYLLTGGFRVLCPFTARVGGTVSARVFHLSNNGLNGSQHNPDINTLGGHVGIWVRF
jgi:hypothetical protein